MMHGRRHTRRPADRASSSQPPKSGLVSSEIADFAGRRELLEPWDLDRHRVNPDQEPGYSGSIRMRKSEYIQLNPDAEIPIAAGIRWGRMAFRDPQDSSSEEQ